MWSSNIECFSNRDLDGCGQVILNVSQIGIVMGVVNNK